MATLAFQVEADYSKVIKLREEITRLQAELNKMQGNGSKEAIETLETQLASARREMKETITAAANMGIAMEESAKKGDFSTMEGQVNALSLAIRQNEEALAAGAQKLQQWQREGEAALQAGDAESLQELTGKITDQVEKMRQLQEETQGYKQALAGLLDGSVDSSFEGVTRTIQQLDQACDQNRAEIEKLQAEYDRLNTTLEKNTTEGSKEEQEILARMQTIKGEVTVRKSLIKEMQEQATALEENASKMQQSTQEVTQTTQAHESLRSKIRQLKQEMADMRMQGIDEQSEAYRRLRDELGRLQDVQQDISRQGSILANDERAIAGVQSGLQGMTGAFMGAQAAVGMFGSANKDLQQVLVKSHYLMTISNAIQQVAATLNKDSAFRLVTLGKAREWWNKLVAIGTGEEIADTAATTANTAAEDANTASKVANTAAQTGNTAALAGNTAGKLADASASGVATAANITLAGAFRMLGAAIKSIPVIGWALAAIGAVAGAVALLVKHVKNANKATEEAKQKAQEFYKAVSEEAYKPIGNVKLLQGQWEKLGDSMEKKQKFVEDNKDKFEALGLAVDDVTSAEKFFTSQAQTFIDAQIAKAKATVLLNQAMDKTKEAAELQQEIEAGTYANTKTNWYGATKWTGELDEQKKKLEQLKKEETDLYDQARKFMEEENATMAKLPTIQRQTSGTDSTQQNAQAAEDDSRYKELVRKQGKERAREITSMAYSLQQAEIDAIKEGNAKTMKQIELDFEIQQTAIEQWYEDLKDTRIEKEKELWEANPANKGKNFDENAAGFAYTPEEQQLYEEQIKANQRKREKAIEEVYQKETESLRDYLKEYGSYEEQRLAITEEYAEKIAKANSVGERMSLIGQRNEALNRVDMEFFDNTDWQGIFSKIDNYSSDYLEKLRGQLQEMLTSDDLTAEQAKAIGDQLAAVNKAIIDRAQTWTDLFGLGNTRLREQQKLQQDLLNQQTQLNAAQEEQSKILANINDVKQRICELLEGSVGIELDVESLKLGNANELMQQMRDAGANESDQNELSQTFTTWASFDGKLQNVNGTIDKLDSGIESTEAELAGMTEGMSGFASSLGYVEAVCKYINMNVQSMNDLLEEAGLGDSKFAKGWSSFAESSQYAMQGIESLKSGDFAGVAANVLGSLRTLGDALGEWTGWSFFGETDKTLHDDMEALAYSNEALKSSIEKLTNEMDKVTTSITEATQDYNIAIENLEKMEADMSDIMSRAGSSHSRGFFGIGSDHSSNYYIDQNMSAADWRDVSNAAGVAVASAEDFWNLTSEQMYNVSQYAAAQYATIKRYADDGHDDVSQYMDEYISYWEQMQDLIDEYNEKLTATDFDSVVSNFQSAIMDMNHSVADFTNDFEDMMKNAMVSSIMSNTYAEELQKWYDKFADYMRNDTALTTKEQDELRDEYMDLVQSAQDEVRALYDMMGWSSEAETQTGSTKAFQAMSEDTGQELNGRFTAMYESMVRSELLSEQQATYLLALSDDITTMLAHAMELTDISDSARTILANSYLELQEIRENTESSSKYLKNIQDDIATVRQNTSRL